MANLHTCSTCSKQGAVAFRVNIRKPGIISRATDDTPKPLCLLCAEAARTKLLEKIKQEKEKSDKKEAPKTNETATKPKEVRKFDEISLDWRWNAYQSKWSKKKPSTEGHYWVWTKEIKEPVLIHLSNSNTPISEILLDRYKGEEEVWFLGPILIPPTPLKAAEQSKAHKKVKANANNIADIGSFQSNEIAFGAKC
jgi:hypothetical protein